MLTLMQDPGAGVKKEDRRGRDGGGAMACAEMLDIAFTTAGSCEVGTSK